MSSINILDCTLRDGGFINDWNFGLGSIISIASRLSAAGIELIEMGFIDERRNFDANRSIFPDTSSIHTVMKNVPRNNSMFLGMIDFGTCSLERIESAENSCLDGIRVIFKKKDQDAALDYISEVKSKGYKVFVNPVAVTGYSVDEVSVLAEKINAIQPYAVAVVDTYGLMHEKDLLRYYSAYDEILDPSIQLGYHSHNNFQMAYANSLALARLDSQRMLTLDSSLFGMGKGAGNANTELLAMYLNANADKEYSVDQLLESIDVDVLRNRSFGQWGYSLPHFLAALNDCHPKYIEDLLDRRTLSIGSINAIAKQIPHDEKLTYNQTLAEELYTESVSEALNDDIDYKNLAKELIDKDILLLGPGRNLEKHKDSILEFIEHRQPIVISINFVSESIPVDFVFTSNSKRYSQFLHLISEGVDDFRMICTSNITEAGYPINFVFNYASLLNSEDAIRDNPLPMLIKILHRCHAKSVSLAGFDGHACGGNDDYFPSYTQYLFCNEDTTKRNAAMSNLLSDLRQTLPIETITPSLYFAK